MNGSSNGDIREPLRFSADDPLSTQWMWLIDEIDYVSKRFPMFLDKNRDMFFAEKIISVFRIIDPANHSENLIRGGYKGLVESSRGNDEKSGIVYAVGIALTYWDIYRKAPAYAEKFYNQALDYPSAFGMVLSYVFVFVNEYCERPSAGADTITSASALETSNSDLNGNKTIVRKTNDIEHSANIKNVPTNAGAEPYCRRSRSPLLLSSAIFVFVLLFMGWYYEQRIKWLRCTYSNTWPGNYSFPNMASNINIAVLSANQKIAKSNAFKTNPPIAYTSYLAARAIRNETFLITMPGGFSAKIPEGYKVSMRESDYIEIADKDGTPSIFIIHEKLDERMSKIYAAVEGEDAILLKSFRKSQETVENKKTEMLARTGLQSCVVQWGEPYFLERFAGSAIGIDFVRQDKMSLLSKSFESRAFCSNIQIINGSDLYLVNIKHITEAQTPLTSPLPKHLLDFISSLKVSKPTSITPASPACATKTSERPAP